MGFFKNSGFLGLGASVAFATAAGTSDNSSLTKQDSRCDEGPGWASLHQIGWSEIPNRQCETQYGRDYTPVTGIEVWRKGDEEGTIIAGIYALGFRYISLISS